MIAFASAVTKPEVYDQFAEPGILLSSEPDSVNLSGPARGSIYASYNHFLNEAAVLDDLEALVLLHQDAEIVDPNFAAKVRDVFADPMVGVAGPVAAVGVRSIAWWEGSTTWASFIHRHQELGGGDFPSITWDEADLPAYARLGEVDSVDGFLMVLSPWVVRNIRFDESLGHALHGYDFDLCLQVREAGRKIVSANLRAVHNHSLQLADDLDSWMDAHVAIAEKWDGRIRQVGWADGSWSQRARRSEAKASAGVALAQAEEMRAAAYSRATERAIGEIRRSVSWRLTAPLRAVGMRWRSFRRRAECAP